MTALLIVLAVLVIGALLLPVTLRIFVNKKMRNMSGYCGQVQKVRLRIFKCRADLEQITINKQGSAVPIFSARHASIDLAFRKLLKKEFFGTLHVDEAHLHIEKSKDDGTENKTSAHFNLKSSIGGMTPFDLDIFFTKSSLTFHDNTSKAPLTVSMTGISLDVIHFSNVLPEPTTRIMAKAKLYEGNAALSMDLKLLASHTTFDMNADISGVNLVLLNSFLQNHVGFDVNRGRFSMATEVACADGKFHGYLKPMITDLDVIGPQDKGDGFFRRVWEAIVAFTYQTLKNKAHDQLASKIKIQGNLDNPHLNVVSAVISVLKNGFIKSLTPSIEDVVSLDTVKEKIAKSREWVSRIIS